MKLIKNAFVFSVAMFLSVLAGEVLLRSFCPQSLNFTRPHPIFNYALRPMAQTLHRENDFKVQVKINSKGLRDNEYPYEKPDDTYRILMLGDSFTFGYGVNIEDTMAKVLEENLNKKFSRKFEVINAGMFGWGTTEALAFLETEGLKYQPDLVILNFFLGNDAANNNRGGFYDYSDDQVKPIYPSFSVTSISHLRSWVASKSHFYKLFAKGKDIIFHHLYRRFEDEGFIIQVAAVNPMNQLKAGLKKTNLLFQSMAQLVQSKKIDIMVVLIPLREQIYPKSYKRYLKTFNFKSTDIDLEKPERDIVKILKKCNLNYLSLEPNLQSHSKNQKLYFEVDVHFTSAGNSLAARLILDEIVALSQKNALHRKILIH